MAEPKRICIDWDHVLVDGEGQWVEGAVAAIRRFRNMGYTVVIHSCRAAWDGGVILIEQKLRETGIKIDKTLVIHRSGAKPNAALYIDNRAVRFEGDWNATIREARERLKGAHV